MFSVCIFTLGPTQIKCQLNNRVQNFHTNFDQLTHESTTKPCCIFISVKTASTSVVEIFRCEQYNF